MHSSERVAEKKTGPGIAQRVALIAWITSLSLIVMASVLWFLEGGNLYQSANIVLTGIAFGLYSTIGTL
ncbi:MAG TPA: hypothetical protein VEH81_14345, partial [Ktedonobacteraceae bacterium]|nr:hypothetical protein [Ktedonobacteraceae bacterium]